MGGLPVLPGGFSVPGRMVMGKDHTGGMVGDGPYKHLTGMDQGPVEKANRNDMDPDDRLGPIKGDDEEVFLLL
jgi:hypothetical protein